MKTGKPAGFWIRAVASCVDGLIIMAAGWILFFLGYGAWAWGEKIFAGSAGVTSLSDIGSFQVQVIEAGIEFVVYLVYYTVFHARTGMTPGKKLFSIRVVDAQTGKPLSMGRSALRTVGYLVSYLPFCAGYLMAAFHPSKLALHDHIARSRVIYLGRRK